ncbi:MAG: hypothetical protein OXN17_00105 [Candidatus Poribacteria bacterium]|nr:hypothetical protein [Candidatus Poribacteria bacterium]
MDWTLYAKNANCADLTAPHTDTTQYIKTLSSFLVVGTSNLVSEASVLDDPQGDVVSRQSG